MQIVVPPLGDSIREATVARWLKKVGDAVAADEPVVELETDKITMEIGAPMAGVLAQIVVPEGGIVAIQGVLGEISEAGGAGAPVPPTSQPIPQAPASASLVVAGHPGPAALKMAADHQVPLESIQGTGKGGRITKEDVAQAVQHPSAPMPQESTLRVMPSQGERRVKMSRLRQRIGERLKVSQNTAAILTTFNEVDMSAVMELRAHHREAFEARHGVKLGFMSFFTQATRQALEAIPELNAEIQGDEIVYRNYYNIGIAVGTEAGLVVPVLKHVERLTFSEIEQEIASFAVRARAGSLSPEDLAGGTFTISNGGVYGSLLSTPIINPPQSGILGLHKIEKRPVVVDDTIVIRPMMYLALSYDHRLIDGREAVQFLVHIKESIEQPERLLLDL